MKNFRKEAPADTQINKIALLIGLACVLQISESMIPHPIPGLRLGLANMMTLIALVDLGFGYALEVAILRTVLSSFIIGTFMSPTFMLSLGGAVISTLVVGLFYWLSGLSRFFRMSIIGISIIGAFVHNLVQLSLAYLLLIKHAGIFAFFPWLSLGAVATGWVVGVVTGGVCRALKEGETKMMQTSSPTPHGEALRLQTSEGRRTWLHRLSADIKLISLITLALALFAVAKPEFYMACFFGLCILLPASGAPILFFIATVRRYSALVLISFLLPVFFHSEGMVLASLGFVRITSEGLNTGSLFAMRILLLVLSSALFMRTTSPEELVKSLERLLWPLEFIGVSRHRTASLLSLAWESLPQLWESARQAIASANLKKIRNMRNLIPALIHLITTLYLKTEPAQAHPSHPSPSEPVD